jgi:hypothetical protein
MLESGTLFGRNALRPPRLRINPFVYLRDVIERDPNGVPFAAAIRPANE